MGRTRSQHTKPDQTSPWFILNDDELTFFNNVKEKLDFKQSKPELSKVELNQKGKA